MLKSLIPARPFGRFLLATAVAVGTFATAQSSNAAAGIFGSYIGLNLNDGGNSWYGADQWGDNSIQSFNGANLGSLDLSTGTAQISAFQVQTFKTDGDDVTGANLFYRVYKIGDTPGAFNTVNAGFLSNSPFDSAAGNSASGGGDQNWGVAPTATLGDLLGGISTTGTFNVEIYFDAGSSIGTLFSNNGGSNFIATMEVVPEPSTYALLGLGAAFGLWQLRRRRLKA